MLDERKRTEPSPNAKFAPPEWLLPNPPTNKMEFAGVANGFAIGTGIPSNDPVFRNDALVPDAQPRASGCNASPIKMVLLVPSSTSANRNRLLRKNTQLLLASMGDSES